MFITGIGIGIGSVRCNLRLPYGWEDQPSVSDLRQEHCSALNAQNTSEIE